jgi:hypothetical protein
MEQIDPVCPSCEAVDELVSVYEVVATGLQPTTIYRQGSRTFAEDRGEAEQDVQYRKFITYRCDSCGYEDDDADEWTPELCSDCNAVLDEDEIPVGRCAICEPRACVCCGQELP